VTLVSQPSEWQRSYDRFNTEQLKLAGAERIALDAK
jgi:hypothetical protein